MNNSSVRLVSIILAVIVVMGSWLLFEYSQQPNAPRPGEQRDSSLEAEGRKAKSQPLVQPRVFTPDTPSNRVVNYQCRGANGTVFRDHPCLSNEKEIKTTVSQVVHSSPDELANLKKRAAEMERSRLASAPPVQVIQVPDFQPQQKMAICQDVDRKVANIDSQLRMRNFPATIDYLNQERRKLMDLRFSSGC